MGRAGEEGRRGKEREGTRVICRRKGKASDGEKGTKVQIQVMLIQCISGVATVSCLYAHIL